MLKQKNKYVTCNQKNHKKSYYPVSKRIVGLLSSNFCQKQDIFLQNATARFSIQLMYLSSFIFKRSTPFKKTMIEYMISCIRGDFLCQEL